MSDDEKYANRGGGAVKPLVLSLFPGIGLLDMAFEEEGFCVVRGPDLLWGGDVRRFHPPAGRFEGVIGGPPCQMFSRLRHLNPDCGKGIGNLIPEFERVVEEAAPGWFVMENVPDAPAPNVAGYDVQEQLVRDVWVGGDTNRLRRFSFGGAGTFQVETLALHRPDPEPAALASASVRVPVRIGGSGKIKRTLARNHQEKDSSGFERAKRVQGLPDNFDLPPFLVSAKVKAVGNGVPLPMGRAVAKAVKRAMGYELTTEAA